MEQGLLQHVPPPPAGFQRWRNAEVRRTSRAGIVANDGSCEAEGATLDRVPASQLRNNSGRIVDLSIGKNPEHKTAKKTGRTFAILSLATQSAWKDANEEWQRRVEWHRLIVIW